MPEMVQATPTVLEEEESAPLDPNHSDTLTKCSVEDRLESGDCKLQNGTDNTIPCCPGTEELDTSTHSISVDNESEKTTLPCDNECEPVTIAGGDAGDDTEERQPPDDNGGGEGYGSRSTREPKEEGEQEEEWADILGSKQLLKKIITPGKDSSRPQRSDICHIRLTGKIKETGEVFENHEEFRFQLGDSEVTQALDLSVALMNEGEEAEIISQPRFGYGKLGEKKLNVPVPPNAVLLYHVTLLRFEEEKDIEQLTVAERKQIGNSKRLKGNSWYEREEYSFATQCYRRALEYLDDVVGGIQIKRDEEQDDQKIDAELQDLLEDRLKVYNNLSAAQMQMEAFDSALQSVETVLKCQPRNAKALFRKGKILSLQGKTKESVQFMRLALNEEPSSKVIQQELNKMTAKQKNEQQVEKNLYQKMLGGGAGGGGSGKGKSGRKKSGWNFNVPWGVVFSGIATVVLGVVSYKYKFF